MAYGFGATFGTASTDRIVSNLTGHSTVRSYAAWVYLRSAAAAGRVVDKRESTTQTELVSFNSANNAYQFIAARSTTAGNWRTNTAPTTGVWQHLVVTYDNTSVSNDPVIYIDGTSSAITESSTPSGTITTSSEKFVIGNRGSAWDRGFDGYISEIAIWDRIITQSEVDILAAGFRPTFLHDSLVMYEPLIREAIDYIDNASQSVTGALVANHPRAIYPNAQIIQFPEAGAAPAAETPVYNVVGSGGVAGYGSIITGPGGPVG